jgi:hypothetical protein
MKYLILLLALLAGCHSPTSPNLRPDTIVSIQEEQLQDCVKELPSLPEGATFEDILINRKDTSLIYYECADRQHSSAVLLRQLSNLPEKGIK